MPLSNLTCTGTPSRIASSMNSGDQATTSAPWRAARSSPVPVSGPKIEDRRREAASRELLRLGGRGDAEPGGAGLQRRLRHRHGAVPVAVGLDHGAVRGALREVSHEPPDVVADRREVDLGEGPVVVRPALRAPGSS